jgi:hypothetical protein
MLGRVMAFASFVEIGLFVIDLFNGRLVFPTGRDSVQLRDFHFRTGRISDRFTNIKWGIGLSRKICQ